MKKHIFLTLFTTLLLPFSVLAHGSHGTGFVAGFTHPILGLDHLSAIFAMTLIGFSLLKGKSWLPSLAFTITMLLGGLLGIHSEAFSVTEWVIVFSVLISGILLAFDWQLSSSTLALLFAFFGFFHGHAHGTEMPDDSNIPLFVLGFVVATGLISALGWIVSSTLKQKQYLQLIGAAIAGMSIMMFLG